MPLKLFHACILHNKQECCIAKATIKPNLEHLAVRIAAGVKAKHPTNHPTLKDLIHDDVHKTMEELRCHVQSLEAELGDANAKNRWQTIDDSQNGKGDNKKKIKLGTVVAP